MSPPHEPPEDVSDLALAWLRGKQRKPNQLLFDRLATCGTARVREVAAGIAYSLARGGSFHAMTRDDKATLLDMLEDHWLRKHRNGNT